MNYKKEKHVGKRKRLWLILLIIGVVVIIAGASAFVYNYEKNLSEENQQGNAEHEISDYTPPTNNQNNQNNPPSTNQQPPAPPAQTPEGIEITSQRLQTLFQKSSYFTRLPSNAAILLTFFDGNGKMRSEKLFISSGGTINDYSGQSYDLEFTMGDYRITELEGSNDFCASLNQIKNQQDLRVSLKNILSVGKYMYLKSCVSF